jgi:hypothetical protein
MRLEASPETALPVDQALHGAPALAARGEACRRVLDRADGCLPHKTRLAAYDQRAAACPVTLSSCSDARAAWVCMPSWS